MELHYRLRRSVPGQTAQAVHDELERIRRARGLTPLAVVDEAARPDNPLHTAFEWDDTRAAHEHRLATARTLIRCVEVVRPNQPSVPAFFHVTVDKEPRYEALEVVCASPDLYEQAVQELRGHISRLSRSVRALEQAASTRPQKARATKIRKAVAAVEVAATA